MPTEVALLESRALRGEQMGRVDVLDKVKGLVMLPDGIHVRTEEAARYFEVSTGAVKRLTDRHQEELTESGLRVLRGADLQSFHSDMVSLWAREGVESYPQAATQLRLYTRRTILNIAMLLRDSDIARCVRTYLLDAEESLRTRYASSISASRASRAASPESAVRCRSSGRCWCGCRSGSTAWTGRSR